MPRGQKGTTEQIIGTLREAEVGLAHGKTVPEVVRKLGVTEQRVLLLEILQPMDRLMTISGGISAG